MESNNIMQLKPELLKDLIIYTRKEKKGYHTFRFNTPALENETLLNSVCTNILNLCNGINTIQEIVEILVESYNMSHEKILKDLLKTLEQFTYFQLISWKGNNPFEPKIVKQINNKYIIKRIDFEQIQDCVNFIRENDKNKSYINPYLNDNSLLDRTLLKTGHLTSSQFLFGLFDDDTLQGVLICANNAKTSVNTIIYYSVSNNITKETKKCFFDTALEITTSMSKQKITKFRLFFKERTDLTFTSLPFCEEYVLKNELGFNEDLLEYNYNIYE